ncbi:class I SAM-dependent methyltransferase [Halosimplex pelagicum]|uniref:Methyltransferase domain-containing protein n=1 Tax=Halosimplex pelagicum TaxID=869886 RepID=A0A7D5TC54_9EURY|nr:class I SAM-dependent methyltransferase [Halosimplex pelagicum]QLH84330.1 methyltransferase domain-containing protein [Halosimplex pelagicum]
MTHWTETVYRDNPDVFRRHLEDRVDDAAEETEALLALLADHGIEPASALDVACGIGRHAVELGDRGVSVRGIDISESYLDRARERIDERGVGEAVTVERADMRDLAERTGEYDLVFNCWTSFGYYDEATDRAVLAGMRDRVADGGALVLELVNREGVLAEFRPAGVPEDDDALVVESAEYDPETARMETTRRVFAETDEGYDYEGEMVYEVRLYAPAELAALCREAGFDSVSLYAGLDGDPLERESTRLVVVAEP